MREILFRGKAVNRDPNREYRTNYKNGDWVYGLLINPKNYDGFTQMTNTDGVVGIDVDPETLGQYTGLTDTNGNKIFEGDIVKFATGTYQIVFAVGSFALCDTQGEMISKIGGNNDNCYSLLGLYVECCWEDSCAYDIEVIGNIQDNQELLKGA